MPDLIYTFGGKPNAPYGDPVVVKASWNQEMWASYLIPAGYTLLQPPWVPEYEQGITVSSPGAGGQVITYPLNPLEFPTQATVEKLAVMYAVDGVPLIVISEPFLGPGPVVSSAIVRLLQWPNNGKLSAFQLANYWTNNPPQVADELSKLLIARIWPTPLPTPQ